MSTDHLEILLFDEALRKVHAYLKPIGLQISDCNRNRIIWKRLRLWFLINFFFINSVILAQTAWFVQSAYTGKSFVELTNIAPCFALCILSNIQSIYFVNHGHQVFKLIEDIRTFQSLFAKNELGNADVKFLKNQMKIFYIAVNSLTIITSLGIIAFGISPFVAIAKSYYSTGEMKLILPFLLAYPFDTNDTRFWLIAYTHQMWSAVVAVLTVLAPGFLYYACSTFIIFQFRVLQNDLEKVIPFRNSLNVQLNDEEFKMKLMKIIDRHGKLIACVDLMEFVYSESTLFNVVTSTLLICLTGFNVTVLNCYIFESNYFIINILCLFLIFCPLSTWAIGTKYLPSLTITDLTLVVPFLQFLLMSLVQIYFMCYYGDMIMIYSKKVADAAYNCQWYRAEISIVKDLMIISARARKPCKMTALRYSDVNFKTFTKILSSSWSYFALLTSLYRD